MCTTNCFSNQIYSEPLKITILLSLFKKENLKKAINFVILNILHFRVPNLVPFHYFLF